MEEYIALCGDDCIECPRYHAHSDSDLKAVAELWYRIGWRERVVSNEDIACAGCAADKQCTYYLVRCTKEHGVNKCNQCGAFPCDKINEMLKRSADDQKRCREICSLEEYNTLQKAFFKKESNLRK